MAALLQPEPSVPVPVSLGHDPAALRGDADVFASRIDGSADEIAAAMAEHGFAVIDGACPARLAAACAAELDACAARAPPPPAAARRSDAAERNASRRRRRPRARAGGAAFVDVVKPGIAELDFHDERCRDALAGGALDARSTRAARSRPRARARCPQTFATSLCRSPSRRRCRSRRSATSACGGCFPVHYDNAGPPSRRAITCLVYVANWRAEHGGELRVLAPLGAAPRDVPPSPLGRCVLFVSDCTLHGTLPARGGAPAAA